MTLFDFYAALEIRRVKFLKFLKFSVPHLLVTQYQHSMVKRCMVTFTSKNFKETVFNFLILRRLHRGAVPVYTRSGSGYCILVLSAGDNGKE